MLLKGIALVRATATRQPALALRATPAARRGAARFDQAHGANGQPVELLEIGGRAVEVDTEIAPLVRALNAVGMETVASCSGHGFRPADIILRDGREIIIARDHAEARRINALFPIDINGRRK